MSSATENVADVIETAGTAIDHVHRADAWQASLLRRLTTSAAADNLSPVIEVGRSRGERS